MPNARIEKRDWLSECNDHKIPLEDFHRQFCSRCVTPDCTRSQVGQSKFDSRVVSWEDRLFLQVPQMSPSDPRYEQIRGKKFLNIDTGRVPEIQSWVDPRTLKDAGNDNLSAQTTTTSSPTVLNTPNKPKQMIEGSPTTTLSDPWEPRSTTQEEGLKVVPPGSKFRF